MNRLLAILLLLFSQIACEHRVYDGSKLVPLSYAPNEKYDASEIVSINNFNQDMISYYSWFASYGYCEDDQVPDSCCTDHFNFFNNKWKIISETSTEKYYVYNFVLWRNDEYKKYIIAFPGTNEVLELLNEGINSKLVDYETGNGIKVVNYFYKVSSELEKLIFTEDILQDIYQHPGYQFIATGHSLGGAVACLTLYTAVTKGYINSSKNKPVLISFGQPRTGNENFVIDFNKKIKNVLRIVRSGDIVVSLPYSPIKNPYRHLGGLILVDKDITSMTYCPKDIGEDYEDKECQKSTSINFKYHTYYFNPDIKMSQRCNN